MIPKTIEKIFKKQVGRLTVRELRLFLTYLGFMKEEQDLEIKFIKKETQSDRVKPSKNVVSKGKPRPVRKTVKS